VLHVAQPVTDGVAVLVAQLAAHQIRSGWRVDVACPGPSWLADETVKSGARHLTWHADRSPLRGVVGESRALRRLLRSRGPYDVVHLHSAKAGLVGRLALRGQTPTVFEPHAWSFLAGGAPVRWSAARWERAAARWTSLIVCGSAGELAQGQQRGLDTRMIEVSNGVDVARFAAAGRDRAAARERLHLGDAPTVVCVGRLTPQKGQDVLLHAWPAVRRQVPQARLVLVGDGPGLDELQRLADPSVHFAGRLPDVSDWLAAADVVAQPSRWEGMPLAVLEAMATGRCVVATDIACMAQALGCVAENAGTAEDSCGGPLVAVGDASALSAALIRRLLDPALRSREGSCNATRAAAFDSDSWCRQMLEVTHQIVTERRTTAA
jgi:glycosyltransferase involved in cell wall biosynthesis